MTPTTHRRHWLRVASGAASYSLISSSCGPGPDAPEASEPAGAEVRVYPDGRPAAHHRLDATDHGAVLRHGDGPGQCDIHGARDVYLWEHGGEFFLFYDGAGPNGWTCCLATSSGLITWKKHGTVLEHGPADKNDSHYTGYGPTVFDGEKWHLFYVSAAASSPAPDHIPVTPYYTMKAEAGSSRGPWRKRYDITPFSPEPGTYYSDTASPGAILKVGDEYRMYFSSATLLRPGIYKRTLGIARTKDLDGPWAVDPEPILPIEEQIENTGLYYEPTNQTWFLFTNHVGQTAAGGEFTESIWVYWSRNPDVWKPENKAIVLDGANCSWAKECIGLPSIAKAENRLAIIYDAVAGAEISNMGRDLGLCWLDLPLEPPA